MFFYIFIVFLVLGISFSRFKLLVKFNLIFFVIVLISLLRFDVGYDYPTYFNYVYLNQIEAINKLEPLSRLIFLLAIYFNYPHIVFLLFGIITYFFIYKGIKRLSCDLIFSVFIYFGLFWLFSLGEIRQAVAVSIVFYAFKYVVESKLTLFILYCFLAALFHFSALIGLSIYVLFHYFNFIKMFISFIIFLLFKFFVFDFFISYGFYEIYLLNLIEFDGGGLMKYFFVFLFLLLLLIYALSNRSLFIYKLLLVISPSIILPFVLPSVIGLRVSQYFLCFYIVLIPYSLSYSKIYLKYLFIFGFAFYFIINIYIGSLNIRSSYTPYQSVFFIEDINFRF